MYLAVSQGDSDAPDNFVLAKDNFVLAKGCALRAL
jgi:hypothetical protein